MSRYSADQKAEAVGLGLTIGARAAGRKLGIPYRNIARWLKEPTSSPVIQAAEATIADRLVSAHERALAVLEARLDDPTARVGELAQAVRVLTDARNLAEGKATANVATQQVDGRPRDALDNTLADLTWQERGLLAKAIDEHLEQRRARGELDDDEREWREHRRLHGDAPYVKPEMTENRRRRPQGRDDSVGLASEIEWEDETEPPGELSKIPHWEGAEPNEPLIRVQVIEEPPPFREGKPAEAEPPPRRRLADRWGNIE